MTGMKRQHTLRILFAVVLLAVIAGCETVPSSGPGALAGQWTNSLGTVWTINPDGTFHVVSTKPKAQIWGTYTLSGDTITVQETRRSGRRSPKIAEALARISSVGQTQTVWRSYW